MLIDIDDKLIEQIQHHEDVKGFIEALIKQSLEMPSVTDKELNKILAESIAEHDTLLKLLAQ